MYSFPQLNKVPFGNDINERVEWFSRLVRKQNKDISYLESIFIAQNEIQRQLDDIESKMKPVTIQKLMPWIVELESMSDDDFNHFMEESCKNLLAFM